MSAVQRCDVSSLNVNDILSRGSILRVLKKTGSKITVQNLDGESWDIGNSIVNNECKSTHITKTEKLTINKIIENVIRRSNGAIMKINFVKLDGEEREMVCTFKSDCQLGRAVVNEYVIKPDKTTGKMTLQKQERRVDYRTLIDITLDGVKYENSTYKKKRKRPEPAQTTSSTTSSVDNPEEPQQPPKRRRKTTTSRRKTTTSRRKTTTTTTTRPRRSTRSTRSSTRK